MQIRVIEWNSCSGTTEHDTYCRTSMSIIFWLFSGEFEIGGEQKVSAVLVQFTSNFGSPVCGGVGVVMECVSTIENSDLPNRLT
jgi:hypothetical protein